MEICNLCKKQFVIKTIIAVINLRSREIENELHLSKSIVSRHFTGEKNRLEIDIFVIEIYFSNLIPIVRLICDSYILASRISVHFSARLRFTSDNQRFQLFEKKLICGFLL